MFFLIARTELPASILTWRRRLGRRRAPWRKVSLVLALVAGVLLHPAMADDRLLQQRVHDFLQRETIQVRGRVHITLDTAQATLPACDDPQPFWPQAGARRVGRVTVGIRCPGDTPSTRYVQAQVRVHGSYFAAARDIAAGHTLTAADVLERDGDITRQQHQLVTDLHAIVGRQALRRIGRSQTIVSGMLKAPELVVSGQRITVIVRGTGFSIRTQGKALNSAGAGDTLRVRTDEGVVLQATPEAAGIVVVTH